MREHSTMKARTAKGAPCREGPWIPSETKREALDDPTIGRFMSEDPARDGVNWYAYCGNNPLSYTDPTGLYIIASKSSHDYAQNNPRGVLSTQGILTILVRQGNSILPTPLFVVKVSIPNYKVDLGKDLGKALESASKVEKGESLSEFTTGNASAISLGNGVFELRLAVVVTKIGPSTGEVTTVASTSAPIAYASSLELRSTAMAGPDQGEINRIANETIEAAGYDVEVNK